MKKRTIAVVIISIVLTLCFVGAVTGTSLAIWKEVKSKDLGIAVTPEINPSLRSQIFAPLDASGNLISFEKYNESLHGKFQYRNITDKGFTLFYQTLEMNYEIATQYAIEYSQLYVHSGSTPYDESLHGERQYKLTKEGRSVLYRVLKEGGGYDYVPYSEILFSDSGDNLYIDDRKGDHSNYIKITKEDLIADSKTNSGETLLYFDTDSLVEATSEQILKGENLHVYMYREYMKDSEDDQNSFGKIIPDNKTNKGFYLYEKINKEYIIKSPTSLTDDAEKFYVSGGEVHSYALVGYTGTVAELVVPSIYTDASGKVFNITRICSSNDYAEESFANNPIITSIIIPASIESIADGTFENLSNLKTLYFSGTGTVRLGQYCFMACKKLERVYTGDGETSSVKLIDATGREIELNENDIVFFGCTSLN